MTTATNQIAIRVSLGTNLTLDRHGPHPLEYGLAILNPKPSGLDELIAYSGVGYGRLEPMSLSEIFDGLADWLAFSPLGWAGDTAARRMSADERRTTCARDVARAFRAEAKACARGGDQAGSEAHLAAIPAEYRI